MSPGDTLVAARSFNLWETSNLLGSLYDDGGSFGYADCRGVVMIGDVVVVLEVTQMPMGFGDRCDWTRATAVKVLSPTGVGWTSDDNLTSP